MHSTLLEDTDTLSDADSDHVISFILDQEDTPEDPIDYTIEEECPICFQDFDEKEYAPKFIPCLNGHVCCLKCLEQIALIMPREKDLCYLFGEKCNKEIHIECPSCRCVVHFPPEGAKAFITVPLNDENIGLKLLQQRQLRHEINKKLTDLKANMAKSEELINEIITKMNEHHRNCSIAKISGSVHGVVGTGLTITGLALIPFTFGVSTGLTIAGSILGLSGGGVVAGASLTEFLLEKNKAKEAQEIIQRSIHIQMDIEDLLISFGRVAQFTGASFRVGIEIAEFVAESVVTGARIGTTIGRGAAIAGGVLSVLLLPLDIYTIVVSSIDIHKHKAARISEQLEKHKADIVNKTNKYIFTVETQLESWAI